MPSSCPACQGPMRELDDGGVPVDACPACGGLWLDRGELSDRGGALPRSTAVRESERRCPRCEVALHVRASDVAELDVCPECSGLFLDAGELALLLGAHGLRPAGAAEADPGGLASDEVHPRCQICDGPAPLGEQVVGEHQTACLPCAERLGIQHDPSARRRAELVRTGERRAPAPAFDAGRAAGEILRGLGWLLLPRRGLIGLVIRLLRS